MRFLAACLLLLLLGCIRVEYAEVDPLDGDPRGVQASNEFHRILTAESSTDSEPQLMEAWNRLRKEFAAKRKSDGDDAALRWIYGELHGKTPEQFLAAWGPPKQP